MLQMVEINDRTKWRNSDHDETTMSVPSIYTVELHIINIIAISERKNFSIPDARY